MTPLAATKNLTVGQRIVWARKRVGVSQERLAEMIGTSRRHMIRLEKDQHKPGPVFVARIAEATEQDPELFASEEDEEEADPVAALMVAVERFARQVSVRAPA